MSLSVLSPAPQRFSRALVVMGLGPLFAAAVASTIAPEKEVAPIPPSTWIGTGESGDRVLLEHGRYGETWLAWDDPNGLTVSQVRVLEATVDSMVFEDINVTVPVPNGAQLVDASRVGPTRAYCTDLRYSLKASTDGAWSGSWTSKECGTSGTLRFEVNDMASTNPSSHTVWWKMTSCGELVDMRWSVPIVSRGHLSCVNAPRSRTLPYSAFNLPKAMD